MKVNKFIFIGAIALAAIGAIAFVSNVKYQEEKKAARSEAMSSELGCNLMNISRKIAISDEAAFLEKPNEIGLKELAKKSREEVIRNEKDCRTIQEYLDKYEK